MGCGSSQQLLDVKTADGRNTPLPPLDSCQKNTEVSESPYLEPVRKNASQLNSGLVPSSPRAEHTGGPNNMEVTTSAFKVNRSNKLDSVWLDPIKDVLKELREKIGYLNYLEGSESANSLSALKFIAACTRFKNVESENRRSTYIAEIANGKFFALFKKLFRMHFTDDLFDEGNKDSMGIIKQAAIIVWNSTDSSLTLCQEIEQDENFKLLLEYLNHKILKPQDLEISGAIYLVKGMCGILHNCLQKLDIREPLRSANAVEIISQYRDSKNVMVKCKTEFLLAYLLTESENAKLNANAENIKFMELILSSAMSNDDHYSKRYGYRAYEIVLALNRLASNDDNKYKIADVGLLKHYVNLLNPSSGNEVEQLIAAKGLWVLSFKLKDQILKENGSVSGLRTLANESTFKNVRKAAKGALWIIDGKDEASSKSADMKKPERGHVMISYQHDTMETLLQVRDRLRHAGYNVWMDVDNMTGSILEAMADAVEKSTIVIICLSQKYKESPHCRTEAEYAYKLQKKIIPLLLQTRYKPDGWLGAIAGNRLYFDLSKEKKYELSVQNLLNELQRMSGSTDVVSSAIKPVTSQVAFSAHNVPQIQLQNATYWSEEKVIEWLNENRLSNQIKGFSGLDGSLLLELRSMYHQAPEFFYTSLRDQLRLSLVGILKFTKALKSLA